MSGFLAPMLGIGRKKAPRLCGLYRYHRRRRSALAAAAGAAAAASEVGAANEVTAHTPSKHAIGAQLEWQAIAVRAHFRRAIRGPRARSCARFAGECVAAKARLLLSVGFCRWTGFASG
jgi:hypothetical protein